jgi:hypothetical protein
MNETSSEKEKIRSVLKTIKSVDHPVITRCLHSSPGLPSFAEGSPHISPENLDTFLAGLRDDISLMSVEPAKKVFRRLDPAAHYPLPESCTPYLDANSLGFYLKPVLPILFVRTSKGEPLLDARVALKYLRENAKRFPNELDRIRLETSRILKTTECSKVQHRPPFLFQDIVQPYRAFTSNHVSFRAGLWVNTPPGISTVIGPPINQSGPLTVLSGCIETDWHHFELFVVAEIPTFDSQVMIIDPDRTIAQMYFVSRTEMAEVRFSCNDPGADPSYWSAWEELGNRLIDEKHCMYSEQKGVASVDLSCPHCYVSVTAAAENGVPDVHVLRRGFNPAYKLLKHEYHAPEKRRRS